MTLDDVSLAIKIAYIRRATLDSERNWTPLGLETSSIVCAPKRLRGYVGDQRSAYIRRPQGTGEHWQSGDPQRMESSGSLRSSRRSIAHPSYCKRSANGNADFLARWPEPATGNDRSGLTSSNPVEDRVSTSYGPAGCALPPRRSQGLVWVGSCPAPKALP